MKGSHSSTSIIDTEMEKKKKGVVYAVFEDDDAQYLIYQLDSVEGGGAGKDDDDDVKELPKQPIAILTSLPKGMFLFSLGSKLYLCGGFVGMNDSPNTYMFDINSMDKGIVSIDSMNSPKPLPKVFGPVDGYQFYVLCTSTPCFEMFDTNTNMWESLPVPPCLSGPYLHPSALCGSNILVSPPSTDSPFGLLVFCTRSKVWRQLPRHFSDDPLSFHFPFEIAHPLFFNENNVQYVLASSSRSMPCVYSVNNDNLGLDPVQYLGDLDDFYQHLKELPYFLGGWGRFVEFFSINYNSVMCIVRTGQTKGSEAINFAIDIFDVRYSLLEEGTKVKVEVKNALKYKYRNESNMSPAHFLFVA